MLLCVVCGADRRMPTYAPAFPLIQHSLPLPLPTSYIHNPQNNPRQHIFTLLLSLSSSKTEANAALLAKELAAPKYAEYHLFFSNLVPPTLLRAVAEADELDSVRQVWLVLIVLSSCVTLFLAEYLRRSTVLFVSSCVTLLERYR